MLKKLRRLLTGAVLLGVCIILFRAYIYNKLITYETLGSRVSYPTSSIDLKNYIDKNSANIHSPDIHVIIQTSLELTTENLNFTVAKNDIDPNKLINTKTAHCVGYANFFTSSCNYLLAKYDLSGEWKARTQIGQLYIFGENIHDYLNSSFLKDHDFVTIENKISGEVIAVDPSLNDYFYIDYINFKK
jgi:hypothetical protein